MRNTVNIYCCSSCREDHKNLKVIYIDTGLETPNGISKMITHCPNTGEQIWVFEPGEFDNAEKPGDINVNLCNRS